MGSTKTRQGDNNRRCAGSRWFYSESSRSSRVSYPLWPLAVLCRNQFRNLSITINNEVKIKNENEIWFWPYKLKVKAKLLLCFNWAPRHEGVLGEWRDSSMHSLTSALDGGEWSASRPGRIIPRERDLGNHWIGGWVGPRAGLDAVLKRKIPSLCQDWNSWLSSP
jgi:hypothetical protein